MASPGIERYFRRAGTVLPIVIGLMMLAGVRSHHADREREVILERHARVSMIMVHCVIFVFLPQAFPYTSVGYLRTQTTPYHYAPTTSLLDQHERTYPRLKLGHVNTDREISGILGKQDWPV